MRHDHWIGGESVAPSSGRYSPIVDPRTRRPGSDEVAAGEEDDVKRAVEAAAKAQPGWSAMSAKERSAVLHRLADAVETDASVLADLEQSCTGKVESQARTEVFMSADYFRYYAGALHAVGGRTVDLGSANHTFTQLEPYGVIGVITPWNYPLNQASRAVAPALAMGNAVVVKPSESTSATTVHLAKLATAAGLPAGILNVVTGRGSVVGSSLISHAKVRKVAFTGSVATGRGIAAVAAERLIPLSLELGGKSPMIVFADANVERAAAAAVTTLAKNAGQVCAAMTRILVQESVFDDFVTRVVRGAEQLRAGVDFGPMITQSQFHEVIEHLDQARREGLKPVIGGAPYTAGPEADGWYLPPTVYERVPPDSRIAREEIFGPVVVIMPFTDECDAVRMANDSEFGLVAGVWSGDVARALRVADRMEAGQVSVNGGALSIDTPFGGHKLSGYGREKGLEALHEYAHAKTISVSLE